MKRAAAFNSPRGLFAAAALLGMLLIPKPLRAGFEDLGAGARPLGMGNAFSAVADDANTIYFNPAGLAALERPELLAGYTRLYMGLDDGSNISHNFLAYAQPLKGRGAVGVGLLDLSLGGYFSERSFALSYSKDILPHLAAGGAFKMLQRSFDTGSDPRLATDPLFQEKGASAGGFSVDAGLLYHSSNPFSFALGLRDLNEPDMGLKSSDPVARTVRLATAYRPKFTNSVFAGDFVFRGGEWDVLLGGERWFKDETIAARLGLGFGSRSDRDVTAGAGYRGPFFQIDYAFQLPLAGVSGTAGTHRFSVMVRFGKPKAKPAPVAAAPAAPYQRTPLEMHLWTLEKELKRSRKDSKATQDILKRMEKRLGRPRRRKAPVKKAAPKPKKKRGKPKTWTVSKGDTLQSIAKEIYGNPTRWVDIYRVNQSRIGAGGKLHNGQTIVIP